MTVIEEKLEQVRRFLFGEAPLPAPVPAPAPVAVVAPVAAAATYTLIDGTAVDIDNLAVGGILKINALPAPAGDYTLSDSTILSVDANGVITNVQSPAPVAAPAAPIVAPVVNNNPPGTSALFSIEQMKEIQQKFAIGGTDERVARLETLCTALMENVFGWELQNAERTSTAKAAIEAYAGVEAAMETSNAQMGKYNSAVEGLFKVVEDIAKTPTAEPLQTSTESFKADKFQKKEDRLKAIAENIANLRKENK